MIGVPLAEVVDDYMLKMGSDSPHKFEYYMVHAKSGLNFMHRQVNGTLKTAKVSVNRTNNTVELPQGFIKLYRLFIIGNNNNIMALSESQNIFSVPDSCGDMFSLQGVGGGISYDEYINQFVNGENKGGYYGIGGRSAAGQYRVNTEAGRIDLGSVISGAFSMIEYIGQPEMVGSDYVVHPYLVTSLQDYIHYSYMKYKRGTSVGVLDYWNRTWVFGMLQGKVDINGISGDQSVDAIRTNFGLPPKV